VSLLRSLLARRDFWHRLAVERLTEPLHLNALSLPIAAFGTTRAKIAFDVIVRQQHAYGLWHAAELAQAHGTRRATVVELGVGVGTGLLNLCEVGATVTRATGVEFDIVGFDTGVGMPAPIDHRDHPELYETGWFEMDTAALQARLPAHARLILGDLEETIDDFVAGSHRDAPLGFATLDVDYYSSSLAALRLFTGPAENYFPYVPVYVDDLALPTHTRFAGELLAIDEFNAAHDLRKLEFDRMLPYARVFKHAEWLAHMFKLHVLDHPIRRNVAGTGAAVHVDNPYIRS
jgi:hypothetical protein